MRFTHTAKVGAVTLVLAALTLAGCSSSNQPAADPSATAVEIDPVELTVAVNEPEGRLNDYARAYFDSVTEASGGKITFEYFYAGSLLPGNQTLTGVGDGVADIGQVTAATFPNELPIVKWMQPLGGLGVLAWPLGSLAEAATAYDLYQHNDVLKAEFEDNNVVPLYGNASPKADMICNKPTPTMADLKGLNVRVASPAQEAEVASLGMVGVYLGTAETYEGLQRGIVDCAWVGGGSTAAFAALGWLEVAPYFIPANGASTIPINFVLNKDVWDGFPAEVQEMFLDGASIAVSTQWKIFTENRADFVGALDKAPNGTFQDAEDVNDELAAYAQKALDGMSQNVPPQITDPEQFIQDYKDLLAAWTDRLSTELDLPKEGGLDEAGFLAGPDLVDWDLYTQLLVEGTK